MTQDPHDTDRPQDAPCMLDLWCETPRAATWRAFDPTAVAFWVIPIGVTLLTAFPPFRPILPSWPYLLLVGIWFVVGVFWIVLAVHVLPWWRVRAAYQSVEFIADEIAENGLRCWDEAMARSGLTGMRIRDAEKLHEALAKALVRRGLVGHVVRLAYHRNVASVPEPLQASFEPVPLDQLSPQFRELIGHEAATQLRPMTLSSVWVHIRQVLRSPTNRQVQTVAQVIVTGFFILSVWARAMGTFPVPWVVVAAFFATGPLTLFLRGASLAGEPRAYVFPGGLAIPDRSAHSGWEILARDEGILIWHQPANRIQLVSKVTTYTQGSWGGTTPAEAELLVRAWLAEAPVPPREHLQGCFGSETP